jgi:hypothetical protein
MFFLRRTQPLALGIGQLRGLRLSLNTPVVATSDLPVGPARAAILVHQEPKQGLALTVGVRSLGCGSVVLYGLEGEITPGGVGEWIDAALAFAEGMGFLFDDEAIDHTRASREKALARWKEAIGEGDGSPPPVAAEPDPEPPPELFELDGDDLADPPVMAELSPDREALDPPAGRPGAEASEGSPEAAAVEGLAFELAPETTSSPPLTKFRPRADTSSKPAVPAGEGERPPAKQRRPKRQALGRLRLERRRAPEVQDVRRGWLLRLLTTF